MWPTRFLTRCSSTLPNRASRLLRRCACSCHARARWRIGWSGLIAHRVRHFSLPYHEHFQQRKHPALPDSPTPSVGIVATRLMQIELKKITRDGYAEVVAEYPGRDKLHHHLGLLSRETEGEELHGVYHTIKTQEVSPIVFISISTILLTTYFSFQLSQYDRHSSV